MKAINSACVVQFEVVDFGIKFSFVSFVLSYQLVVECNLLSPLSVNRVRSIQRS